MIKLIHLQSKHHSVIIKTDRVPEILHWGAKIAHIDEDLLLSTERPISQARLDVDVPLSLCPELGSGHFNAPGIEGHRHGFDWAPVFHCVATEEQAGGVTFRLVDETAALELIIELRLNPETDVLQKCVSVTNLGESQYCLSKLSATLPLPNHANELMTFHGRWCHEFHTQRQRFEHGGFMQENRRGRTSHENFPGVFAGTHGFSEELGQVWGFHLGWSGNHQMRADVRSDGRRFVQAGELLLAGEIILQPGESYQSPWLYGCYSHQGLNGITQRFHQFVRDNIVTFPNDKPRPVHLNTWEGIYFNHQPEYIMQMATEAAEMGVERFIIDDGWFVGRNGERSALGDWYLDEVKYPNGLEPVIEHVNQHGMEFGLWVEPEMVSQDSNLYRHHPDWVLGLQGYHQPSGRWQYVLDLQNDDCFRYLFDRLNALLTRFNITYLKWDMNRELVQPGHQGRAAVHGQTHALYRLIDKLHQTHPAVEIESCASGGGRIDFEILKRTQRFWASDCNDALERQSIQKGMSYFFPPEVMGAHIGPAECHSTNRRHSINMRGVTALGGHMGVELDPVKESREQKATFSHYIALHKQYRHLLHHGRSFRIDPADHNQTIYGVTNDDEMLITVCQLTMPEHALPSPLRIRCADINAQYRVTVVDMPQTSFQLMKQRPKWLDKTLTLSGDNLKEIGLTLPILDPESALIVHLRKQ
ncbi:MULTISPECIES: alpha-galactosidase [unclassified Vibrio]|uniref:alpha-galactosidase n=1 Tax=unclassified Vibrio TaxID=2614977 RepID=UPI001268139C|nr:MULTISPECIES: alpha-galactosidase [unclassified Vibrio]QFT39642.1 Alpha-galactosidase [Vibrio sp. THAF64]QGM37851.1 Alpha-galactosidase [Vibrio sp. THAF191d]QGN73194.1 Alpha-galactosidase [Vibrio sp. THAF191c]